MNRDLDRVVHEPARLRIMMVLSDIDEADFKFMLSATGATKGNLSSHMDRLERAGYVKVLKSFNGRIPQTRYYLTREGKSSLSKYWASLDKIRGLKTKEA